MDHMVSCPLLKGKYHAKSVLSIICFFVLSLFCVSSSYGNDKYGGELILSTISDPKSFNLIMAKETSTSDALSYIFEGLTTQNAYTAKMEPHLAQSWDISEDGLTWIFYLREDVKWHDGVAFTADDVVFTFKDLIYNLDIPASSRDIFTIDDKQFEVIKIDDHTVKFILPVKFAPFLRFMAETILPKHKLKKSVELGVFTNTWGIDTDPKDIVGTGMFRLIRYDPGQRLVYERNPFYWKKSSKGDALPYIDKVITVIVQNQDVALLKFLEGTTDSYGLRGMDYPFLKPYEDERKFTIYNLGPTMGSQFVFFNQNPGTNPNTGEFFVEPHKLKWFQDINFRKAVAHVIDKEKIIEIVNNQLGYPQHSSVGPGAGFYHNPNVLKYDYNPQKAKEYLEKGGYRDRNNDGIIEDAEGNAVKFNLYTNPSSTDRVDIAGIIRQDLEDVGMSVNFRRIEFNTLVGKLTATFEWEAIILGLTGGIEPHGGKNVWTSQGQLHMWYPRQESPATKWEKRIDEIFNSGVQELDEQKRKILYDEFQFIVSENLPLIYTTLGARIFAVRNKFENLDPTIHGGIFHNLEEISIKKEFR